MEEVTLKPRPENGGRQTKRRGSKVPTRRNSKYKALKEKG